MKLYKKKGKEKRIHPRGAKEVIRKQVRVLMNDGSSGMINMIVGGIGSRMNQRGKKRGRHRKETEAEVMQVSKDTLMTIFSTQKMLRGYRCHMKMPQ